MSTIHKSSVWQYFILVNENIAKCKICEKDYSRKGRGTTSLKNHLQSKHEAEYWALKIQEVKKNSSTFTKTSQISLQRAKSELKQEEETIPDFINKNNLWDNYHIKSKSVDFLIAEMLAMQDLPFTFVEGIGFKRLIHYLAPQYDLKDHNYFTRLVCDELYNKVANKIKKIIQDLNKLSFASDIWSDNTSGITLLILTCHGISSDFRKINVVLEAEILTERHTGEYISSKFEEMLQKWDIEHQRVHCVVRDAGSNMFLSEANNIDCTAHKLHLVVNKALKSNENVISLLNKCKKIATHFNQSTAAQDELKNIQLCLEQPLLKIVQERPTRWNSTYFMLERMVKIKDSLCLYSGTTGKIEQINMHELALMEKLIILLKPFQEVTEQLSSSSHVTISLVIPLIKSLILILNSHEDEQQNEIKDVICTLKSEMTKRFENIEKIDICICDSHIFGPSIQTKSNKSFYKRI